MRDTKMPRIAVVGSRQYENKRKVKDLIFDLKKKFGTELTIVSGGCPDGADKYAKKYAIELGVQYAEYNPAYTPRNLYSQMPEYYYGKEWHVTQYTHRNGLIAKDADYCIALISNDCIKANGTKDTIKKFKKLDKPVVIIS